MQIKHGRLKKDRVRPKRRLYCRLIIYRLIVWTLDSFENFRLMDLAFGSLTEYFWHCAWISGIVRVPTKRCRQTVEFFTGHNILTRSLHPRSTKAVTWMTERGITLLTFHLRVYVMFIQSMSDHCESNKRIPQAKIECRLAWARPSLSRKDKQRTYIPQKFITQDCESYVRAYRGGAWGRVSEIKTEGD